MSEPEKKDTTVISHKRIPLKIANEVAVKEIGVEGVGLESNLPQSRVHDSSRTR